MAEEHEQRGITVESDKDLIPMNAVQQAVAGSVVYPPGGRFGPRVQQDIQLVLLYTGEMDVTIDGNLLHVQPGHVVLLKPGREESFVFARNEHTWHRWIAVTVDPLSPEQSDYLYRLPVYLPLTDRMNGLTDLMLSVQSEAPPDDPLLRSLGLAALHLYPTESDRIRKQNEKHPSVYLAIAWIREHYGQEATLEGLAGHAGISPEHLVRLFRRHEGKTPIQFVWQYRVERAVELLRHTGLTVSEVGHRCGFKTSHHFARMIKQSTGRTPSEIRKFSWEGLRKN
ncbi:MAG: AraC family transcriptional regulator [Cohnella sp.]|jgi:AraC-like DNA-binding protein|nr:AraC family transcriptional regulator [Cohnella sp.]